MITDTCMEWLSSFGILIVDFWINVACRDKNLCVFLFHFLFNQLDVIIRLGAYAIEMMYYCGFVHQIKGTEFAIFHVFFLATNDCNTLKSRTTDMQWKQQPTFAIYVVPAGGQFELF